MTAEEFRAALSRMGITQSGLARRMKELGATGTQKAILRAISRTSTGQARVSNEMAALVALMEKTNAAK